MSSRRLVSLLVVVFGLFVQTNASFAQPTEAAAANGAPAKEEGINIAELAFGHVADSHEWHFFSTKNENGTENAFAFPLPMILFQPGKGFSFFMSNKLEEWHRDATGQQISNSYEGVHIEKNMKEKVIADDGSPVYDLSITKNVLSMMIGVILLLWIMTAASKNYKYGAMNAPKGLQNFIEIIVIFIRDEVAVPNLGAKAAKFTPLLLTIFFFIWINNLLGLLPGGANLTGNIAVTGLLALIAFIVMIVNANKHFWSHLLNPPNVPFLVKCLLVLIELMSLLIKPVALMIRLFANMLAGHFVILCVICVIFIFAGLSKFIGGVFVPVSLAFSIFLFMLELLVAAIQAFIFANLTAVFLGQAVEEAHGHDAHDANHAHGHA